LGTGAGIRGTGLDVEELEARRGAEPKEVGLSTPFDSGECNGAPVRWEDVAGILAAEGGLTEGFATCAPNLVLAVETDDLAAEMGGILGIDVDARGEPVGKFFFVLMVVRAGDDLTLVGCLRRPSREPVDPLPEGFSLRPGEWLLSDFLGAFFAGANKSESLSALSSFSDATGCFRFAVVLPGLLIVSNEEEAESSPTLLSFTDLAGAAIRL